MNFENYHFKEINKDEEDVDDDATFGEVSTAVKNTMAPRWSTKLFAIQCVKQLMTACKDIPHHVDLTKARQKQKADPKGSCLVFLLSDLVRATFIASTSYSDQLRREGLSALQVLICKLLLNIVILYEQVNELSN